MPIRFRCEGGALERLEGGSLTRFVQNYLLADASQVIDLDLVAAARAAGLEPQLTEHLAFQLPLALGGAYEPSNLGVESTALHLGTLSQITVQTSALPEGTPIDRIVED